MSEIEKTKQMLAEYKVREEMMRDTKERKELMWHFLDKTFFTDWRKRSKEDRATMMYTSLELMVSSSCNLNCEYCYYHQNSFGPELNPPEISKKENLLDNTRILFNYLKQEKLYPKNIELFGGEIFLKPVVYKMLDMVADFIETYPPDVERPSIVLPTNFSWITRPELVEKVENLYNRFKDIGTYMALSASIDGKYMDPVNRPSTSHREDQHAFYTDERYDKIFKFAKKYNVGFHPMIHYNNIEQWSENFTWFQRKFHEFDIPWHHIYLLEVRNDGWTKDSIKHYGYFFEYVLDFIYNKCGQRPDVFMNEVMFAGGEGHKNRPPIGLNLINNISTVGRGIGCSMQTALPVRMGDLMISPCHRQSYNYTSGFQFLTDGNTITDIELFNLEYYLAMATTSIHSWPYCESCIINNICTHGCPGSQFESMGDPFTPIPSVCLLQFEKVKAEIRFFERHGLLEDIINKLEYQKANSFKLFYKILKGE